MSTIVIRDVETLAEMREVEELQRKVWRVSDLDVVPALLLKPLKEVGAILIGAFGDSGMIGFVFGSPGFFRSSSVIHSDMLAVLPEFRSQSLGYLLKLAQRERALKMGIDTITWTFDPLQSRNAHLNFAKLGVVADRYEVNFYGETSSALHQHGTDRLWVTWKLNSERVTSRLSYVNRVTHEEHHATMLSVSDGFEPQTRDIVNESATVSIEIPQELDKVTDHALLMSWREATRHSFQLALSSGYVVTDYVVAQGGSPKVGRYILSKSLAINSRPK